MSSILKPVLGDQLELGHPLAPERGLWLFNEGSGGQVSDLSGNEKSGAFNGNVAWGSGECGSAIYTPGGVDDRIEIAHDPIHNFAIGEPFSVVAGILSNSSHPNGSGYPMIVSKGNANYELFIYEGTPNVAGFGIRDNGSYDIAYGSSEVMDDKSHVLAGTYDGSNVRIYRDGFLDGGPTAVSAVDVDTGELQFGARLDALEYSGIINFVYMYGRLLTAFEIALLSQWPFCMFERELIELWAAATQGGEAPTVKPMWYYQEMMRRAG